MKTQGISSWFDPLIQLTLARVREFVREPEAVFWAYVFPVLLAFVLGIAFRNTAPQKLPIAVEITAEGQPDPSVRTSPASATEIASVLSGYPGLQG
ncbi:MAG TPA: hypothetical protein VLZ81_05960, partial [Blastocatellia bacterium]|nr:hypothetical protein [Blastocatellia bacterium]